MNAESRAALLAALFVLSSLAILLPAPPAAAAGQLQSYMTGLNWPVALAFAPGGRVFFAERNTGNIRVIEGGILLAAPFYTLTNTAAAGERGLLGLALDPGFPSSPYVYAYQTYTDTVNGTVYNRIVRILASGNTGTSHSVILRMPPLSGATNHNGGVIAFGPDGKLYAVVGENANPSLSQNPMSPMGKVLRMNPDGSVPTDNPFTGSLTWDNLVYTYGHRNNFGLTFHPATGRAYVTENGPACNDEINLLVPGNNYGWGPTFTCATPPPPPSNTNRDGPIPVLPIDWYTPTTAPTNAAVYRGPNFTAWQGDLIFGEWNTGRLRRLDLGPPNYDTVLGRDLILTAPSGILDVESGPDGAIWFTTQTTIYRFVDAAAPPNASFFAIPSLASPGEVVTFNASASSDPDGRIVSYSWDFGDATSGSGVVATHAYPSSGVYTVTLTVVDNESYSGTASRPIVVDAPPRAAFAANRTVSHIGIPIGFDASASSDPDGPIVLFAWDFGDGASGTGVRVDHGYGARGTFTIALTVADGFGRTDRATAVIEIRNRAPAIASGDPPSTTVSVESGRTQTFSVVAGDPDGDPVTYTWRVDGATAGTNASSMDFAAAALGTHTVNVTVSDGSLADWREWTVTVGSPTPAGQSIPWWLAGVALVLVVLSVLAFLLWSRRRRRRRKA